MISKLNWVMRIDWVGKGKEDKFQIGRVGKRIKRLKRIKREYGY